VVSAACVLIAAASCLVQGWALENGIHGAGVGLQRCPNGVLGEEVVAVVSGFLECISGAHLAAAGVCGVLDTLERVTALAILAARGTGSPSLEDLPPDLVILAVGVPIFITFEAFYFTTCLGALHCRLCGCDASYH